MMKYKVGQVVCLDKVKWYKTGERKAQQYQRIVVIYPWKGGRGVAGPRRHGAQTERG